MSPEQRALRAANHDRKPKLRLTERGFLVLVMGPILAVGILLMLWASQSGVYIHG